MQNVVCYTDGGCRGNGKENAVGGYGIVMFYTDESNVTHKKELKKGFQGVTNNQMELQAVIDCLLTLKRPCNVTLVTDSKYVCNAINEKWLDGWKKRGWVNSSKQPVKNKEQWQDLSLLLQMHNVSFFWVKGHSTNEWNNRCDELANEAMDEIEKFLK